MKQRLIQLLKDEVKPALGCTDPIAVCLAAAKAKEILNDEVVAVEVITSGNIFKNGMCVGIPGTDRIGLVIATALGICGGDASLGLKVLETLTPETVRLAEEMMDKKIIAVRSIPNTASVYINVKIQGIVTDCEVAIEGMHDTYTYLRRGDQVLLSTDKSTTTTEKVNIFDSLTLKELAEIATTFTEEEIGFLWEGVEMNKAMAKYGMEHDVGGQIGKSIQEAMNNKDLSNDLLANAMLWTASASDARMSGVPLPVMSSSGSGNHGLTAILPIAVYAEMYNSPKLEVLRALALSHLLTSYIKSYTGRLSAVCGCGVAAATGCSFGLAYLMGLGYNGMEKAVEMMIAGISGMICDGAKAGCAVKLAIAASAAVESCMMAKTFASLPKFNGIVGTTIEQSIKNLGTVCNLGMIETDNVILSVMNSMNK